MEELNLKNIINFGDRRYLVSTISTPVRHVIFEGENRIVYETMIFPFINDDVDYESPLFNERYHTADEAIYEYSNIIKTPEAYLSKNAYKD